MMMAGYTCQRPQHLQLVQCVACLVMFSAVGICQGSALSIDYYKNSCPDLEAIVKYALLPIFVSDPRSPSAFLRLLFHDCQVQGCDAYILLDSDYSQGITSEMLSYKSFGIRNRDSVAKIKSVVEALCPAQVSCADILALAAREAVAYAGGPRILILLGRKDSTTSSNLRADAELASPSLGVDGALVMFMAMGMNVEETVAILGAHTIGTGHCINIAPRLYNSNTNRNGRMDSGFEAFLRIKCPTEVPMTNATFIASDLTTLLFDNQYYKDVVRGRGLFAVDSAISEDPRTAPFVGRFAEDQGYFFRVFSSAFFKLSSVVNPVGGQVRRQCSRVNAN